MERKKLIRLLKQMAASAASGVEQYKIVSYCWTADRAVVDYCGDESLVARYNDHMARKDFDGAICMIDEVMEVIFDGEIYDCYNDFICAILNRPQEYIN